MGKGILRRSHFILPGLAHPKGGWRHSLHSKQGDYEVQGR